MRGFRKARKVSSKKRIIPVPRKGGFLTLVLSLLGALGAVGGGEAAIAKAVNYTKPQHQQLDEEKKLNLGMETTSKGRGLYLGQYKGYRMYLRTLKLPIKLPR